MTYSSAASISRGQYAVRNQNAVSFSAEQKGRRFGPVSNTIILIVLACTLGILYLGQVTKANAFGYQINGLQQEQSQLKADHDNLTLESARLQSLSRAENSKVASAMVPVTPSGTVSQ